MNTLQKESMSANQHMQKIQHYLSGKRILKTHEEI